jgi:hypothetical protein
VIPNDNKGSFSFLVFRLIIYASLSTVRVSLLICSHDDGLIEDKQIGYQIGITVQCTCLVNEQRAFSLFISCRQREREGGLRNLKTHILDVFSPTKNSTSEKSQSYTTRSVDIQGFLLFLALLMSCVYYTKVNTGCVTKNR